MPSPKDASAVDGRKRKRKSSGAVAPGAPDHVVKKKVMVYVSDELYEAAKLRAVEERRSASDLYAEAARAYLAERGIVVDIDINTAVSSGLNTRPSIATLTESIIRQGEKIEAFTRRLDDFQPKAVRGIEGNGPAGTKTAHAMRAVLRIVYAAGIQGIESGRLNEATFANGITSGAAEGAKAILRDAAVLKFEKRRWFVAIPSVLPPNDDS